MRHYTSFLKIFWCGVCHIMPGAEGFHSIITCNVIFAVLTYPRDRRRSSPVCHYQTSTVTYSIIKPVRILATTRAPERWGVLFGVLFFRSNQRCLHFTKTPDLVLTFPSPGAESSRTTVLAQREKRSLSLSVEVSKPDTCGGFNSSAHPWGFPCSAKSQKKMKRPQVSKTAGAVNSLTLSRDKEDSLVQEPLCPKPIRHLRYTMPKETEMLAEKRRHQIKETQLFTRILRLPP